MLQFPKTKEVKLWISGNLLVTSGGGFRVQTRTSPATADLLHVIFLQGNLSHNGLLFDLRSGSVNSTAAACNVVLEGSADQTLTVSTPFSTTNGEFSGITVNKTGTGRVLLGSNISLTGGSSSNPRTYPQLNLLRGKVYTGDYTLIHRYAFADSGSVAKWSDSSYVIGALARGMSSSSGVTRTFPVGDEDGLRPVSVRSTTGGGNTGHFITVRWVRGNANTGTSTLSPTIDKVSSVRYVKLTYGRDTSIALSTMNVDRFRLTYGTEDGVGNNNNDLRIAVSTDNRVTWTGLSQVIPDTTFKPDAAIQDSMAAFTVNENASIYLALARITGTTTNSLAYTTAVEHIDATPQEFSLHQNYPNPFNPTTEIRFTMSQAGKAKLQVYNLLGQMVTTLVDGVREAGTHLATWNGRDASGRAMPSGIYLYRLESGSRVEMRKMVLMK
jgi:hypothetical protein